MTRRIPVQDPDSGEHLGDVEVCDAHGEAGCLTFGPCADIETRGYYDGFGVPIYLHQEDDMPTELPPGFKGTGKRSTPNPPIPTEIRLPPARTEVEDDSDDLPGWAKLIGILVMMIGSWVLVGWAFWVIKHLVAFALGLTS